MEKTASLQNIKKGSWNSMNIVGCSTAVRTPCNLKG